jgi:hypothetical protein
MLEWDHRGVPVLQGFYMTSDANEFVCIADLPEWLLLLGFLSEHFKMVKEALASLQGSVDLLEQNIQRIHALRVELCELHGVKKSAACEQDGSLDCNDPDVSIATVGSGVETVVTLERVSMCSRVLENAKVFGLDAGDVFEDLDVCGEEKLSVAKDVTAVVLTTVHGLYLIELDTEKEGSKLTPTLPLSFPALCPGQMQDLVRSLRPTMLVSLPAGAPHDVVGELLKLKRLLRNNAVLRTELAAQAAKHASANAFDECWGPLRVEFPTLRMFACGLASGFPGSSTVESDFSLLKINRSDNRSSLADLRVEGEFHARQWTAVERRAQLAESKNFVRRSETQREAKNDE